ncbi:LysR family transcriptional regulator (plasmid) [Vibrio nigripulchritudo]|uniref:LysR family transcriptional regulator n=1 Tax=Vibrio nigripulchritudo TaxID=28173 RepID=UPI00190B2B6F|nr:LysR family transcriptional regulator [Vibrio nigripulchritudo]BCL73753.1 LysR family transcriptional regulator [Vibrio nigripulchritudo]BDU35129.1 LysR family transcriptional regulator [Vibrio nigripulchritudo]
MGTISRQSTSHVNGIAVDFNQVRYFLALADTLNFTRAAEQCFVSQSALTQAIKRLEKELGGELIRRDVRHNELTELGRPIRSHFEQIDRTRPLVRATAKAVQAGEVAELNIGLMCTIGPGVLAPILDAFRVAYPKVSILLHDVAPESIPEFLLSSALDGAFYARHGPPHPQLHYVELFEEPMVIAFAPEHSFAARPSVPLRDIANEPYVERLHCEFREEVLEYYRDMDLELNVTFRSEREDWIKGLVGDGVGVCCIPRYSLLRSNLESRPIVEPTLSRHVAFATAAHVGPSPAVEALADVAKHHDWPDYAP